MRLSKFLTLSVAMSRNQAKFFIRKGRVSVNGKVVTDPNSEWADDSHVIFDGQQISIAGYQYILLHKPASYVCAIKDTDFISVLDLIQDRSVEKSYYFANALGLEQTGLVLLSDDARWASRMRRRLSKKTCVYQIKFKKEVSENQFRLIKQTFLVASDNDTGMMVDIQRQGKNLLLLSLNHDRVQRVQEVLEVLGPLNLGHSAPHLLQLGMLRLGDLKEGDYLELTENEIKI